MIQKILVPVDFSLPSRQALSYAVELSRRLGARLAIVHVIEAIQYAAPADILGAAANLGMLEDEQRRMAQRELARASGQLAKRGIKVETILGSGSAAQTIVRTAARLKADLIVMATHGRTWLSHLLMGSVAERVLRETSCPVLTLRPKQGRRSAPRQKKAATRRSKPRTAKSSAKSVGGRKKK